MSDLMSGPVNTDPAVTSFNNITVNNAIVPATHYQLAVTIFKVIFEISVVAAFIADHFGLAVAADKAVFPYHGFRLDGSKKNRVLPYLYTFAAIEYFPTHFIFILE